MYSFICSKSCHIENGTLGGGASPPLNVSHVALFPIWNENHWIAINQVDRFTHRALPEQMIKKRVSYCILQEHLDNHWNVAAALRQEILPRFFQWFPPTFVVKHTKLVVFSRKTWQICRHGYCFQFGTDSMCFSTVYGHSTISFLPVPAASGSWNHRLGMLNLNRNETVDRLLTFEIELTIIISSSNVRSK